MGSRMSITLSVREKGESKWSNDPRRVPRTFKGRKFQDPGTGLTIELFMTWVMAMAIDRTPESFRDYAADGELPRSIFRLEGRDPQGRGGVYYYSASQVLNVHRLFMGKYGGRKWLDNNRLERLQFFKDMTEVWYEDKVVIAEDGRRLKEEEYINV